MVEERSAPASGRDAALEAAGLHGALLSSGSQQWVPLEPEESEGKSAGPQKRLTVFWAAGWFPIVLFFWGENLELERARFFFTWRKA
jgi:hypothetical protein